MMRCRLLPFALLLALPCLAAAQDGTSRPLNPLAALDEATLKGFVEQPLFEPSRHPPVAAPPFVAAAAPAPPPAAEPPPSLRLLGLVEGAHSLAAIVHRNDTGRTETLRPGDRIGGWIVEVMPATLRVSNGDRAFDYPLFRGGPVQGPVAVEPPPAFVAPTMIARDPVLRAPR